VPEDGKRQRIFDRFQLPVVIEAPALSEVPLVPENISAGGFGVTLAARPEPRRTVDCILQVAGEVFRNCRAEVVWVGEDGSGEGLWKAGLSVELAERDRARLEGILRNFHSEFPAGD
jgi:hypothetical protein